MIFLALTAAAALPASLSTFKDWTVGCDNTRVCQANALVPDGEDAGSYLMLTIHRGAQAGDRATLSIPLPDGTAIGSRFTLKVDGAIAASFAAQAKDSAALPLTGALLATLGKGTRISLADVGGHDEGKASLAGLAAVLRFVDDRQHRAGTVGALVATGSRPDSDVPAPPAPPVIATPASSALPTRTISVAEAAKLIGSEAARCASPDVKLAPRAWRLDAGHSLVLIADPCGNGAYNFSTEVYVLGATGAPQPARFDSPPGMGEPSKDDTGQLTNGDWDPKTRELSSYEKGRGLGDCGSSETFAWDGTRFRLVEQNLMGDCRGSIDYIRIWTAHVGRR